MTEEQYKDMEERAKAAFEQFPESHAGTYYPLTGKVISSIVMQCMSKSSYILKRKWFRNDRGGAKSAD